jgi:hypothetical protein
MSDVAAAGLPAASRDSAAERRGAAPDTRRYLQLALAAIWLLDGVLQFQSFMFTRGFGQMLAGTAAGNPAVIADPITWAAGIVEHHPVGTNAAFATIQLLLGLGIACRPTVRVALAASVVWSVGVWWLGEGLGGVLTGDASPLNGAPGAVIIYVLLAVLLWPRETDADTRSPCTAARPLGVQAARAVWLVLWGSLSYFAVAGANRAPQGIHDMIAGMAPGEPGWLAWINRNLAGLLAHQGLAASIVLAVLLAAIAVGVYLPPRAERAAVVLAVVVALAVWVAAQDLGGILAGGSTDPNSGLPLVLLALAYWPLRSRLGPAADEGISA